ncbi:hypothetical protein Tco_0064732 [Tanacetum coccineum]
MSWNSILLVSDKGGLGVDSLEANNLSHGSGDFSRLFGVKLSRNLMVTMAVSILRLSHSKIANGYDTLFWKDAWCDDGERLMDLYPRLFVLESYKDCKIKDRRALDDPPFLTSHIDNLRLSSNGCDKWSSNGDTSVPLFKIIYFVTLLLAPHKSIVSRGVNIPSSCCPLSTIALSLALVFSRHGEKYGVGGTFPPFLCFPRSRFMILLWVMRVFKVGFYIARFVNMEMEK